MHMAPTTLHLAPLPLVLAALLGACASASPPPADLSGPLAARATSGIWLQGGADLSGQRDITSLMRWWQQFHEPELDALVALALERNTDLLGARATLRQAQAARAATEAGARPQVGSSVSALRSASRDSASNQFQLGFSASWEPDLSGAQAAGIQAAEADEQAARADLDTTRMSLTAEVGLAYVQWRGAQARGRITRDSLSSLEQTLQLTRWRAQAGLASGLDVEQAQLSTEQTRASLPALATEISQYEHQLALLTGRAPAELRGTLAAEARVPEADAALERLAVGLPADLLRQRPDLRAAEAALRAQWARWQQSQRAGWPGLSLNGSLGLQALTLSGLGSAAAVATLAASVDWSLFDGGQRASLTAQQAAALDRSRAAYDGAVLLALKDVEDSLAALRGTRERSTALQQAASAAANTLLWQRQRQSAGLTDVATLLEAQRTELGTLLSLQSTQTDLSLNLIRVYKALGGGWSVEDNEPAKV